MILNELSVYPMYAPPEKTRGIYFRVGGFCVPISKHGLLVVRRLAVRAGEKSVEFQHGAIMPLLGIITGKLQIEKLRSEVSE